MGNVDAAGLLRRVSAGASLIGWQINHGAENAAEYVTAAQIRKSLNRPDIVAKAIQLASAEEAVKQSAGTKFKLADLLAMPVPRFRIVSPAAGATLAGGTAQLELALEETPDPVNLIRLYVNGVQVNARQPEDGPGFEPGPLTVLIGPNGAGKTTTVRTLGTLIAPTSGSAVVAGIPLSAATGAVVPTFMSSGTLSNSPAVNASSTAICAGTDTGANSGCFRQARIRRPWSMILRVLSSSRAPNLAKVSSSSNWA